MCKLSISESLIVVEAEKMEFEGVNYKSDCCGSFIGKGNSMYAIMDYYHNEVIDEMCGRCLKKYAYYKKHQYDDFDASEFGY